MNRSELAQTIKETIEKYWKERSYPVFLSLLPELLRAEYIENYKEIIGDMSLKQFVKENGQEYGYRLIEDTKIHAKIALVPSDVKYEFEDNVLGNTLPTGITKEDIDTFFKVLGTIARDKPDLMLPASMIAKLISIR